jgi:hypothetical protein
VKESKYTFCNEKSGLIRGIAFLEGDNVVVQGNFCNEKSGLIRGIAFLEGDNVVVQGNFPLIRPLFSLQKFPCTTTLSPSRKAILLIRPLFSLQKFPCTTTLFL